MLLEQVWMNGLIARAWTASGGDVDKFKVELCNRGEENGYLFDVGDVAVVDDMPVIDWPCVYIAEADQRRAKWRGDG
jgi:hypothetical protein